MSSKHTHATPRSPAMRTTIHDTLATVLESTLGVPVAAGLLMFGGWLAFWSIKASVLLLADGLDLIAAAAWVVN